MSRTLVSNRGGARSLEDVAALQRHLLPAMPPAVRGYRFAVYYRPCEAAGGDYYGFQPFADGRCGFVIADVAGHGAGAAVMMAVLRTALASFRVFGRLRESAAQDVNLVLREISVPGVFVTAFFGSLDPADGALYSGNCGHPLPLVRRRDGVTTPLADMADVPLGVLDHIEPPMVTTRLAPGDAVVMYTDGVVEHPSEAGGFFGVERLTTAVAEAPQADADGILASILTHLARHAGQCAAGDDQCIVVCSRDVVEGL